MGVKREDIVLVLNKVLDESGECGVKCVSM